MVSAQHSPGPRPVGTYKVKACDWAREGVLDVRLCVMGATGSNGLSASSILTSTRVNDIRSCPGTYHSEALECSSWDQRVRTLNSIALRLGDLRTLGLTWPRPFGRIPKMPYRDNGLDCADR